MTKRPLIAILYGSAAVAGFVAAVTVADRVLLPVLVRRGQTVRVPDVTGLWPDEATSLMKRAGLKLVVAGEKFDTVAQQGTLCAQLPQAGSPVKHGRHIRALVSRGARTFVVPHLAGLPVDHARVILVTAGLRTRTALTCPSSTFPAGATIASSPAAEETIGTGETIDLLISAGAPPICYLLPDLRGRKIENVGPLLQRAGLEYRAAARASGFAADPGLVLQQNPRPGSRMCQGDTLTLRVSGESGA